MNETCDFSLSFVMKSLLQINLPFYCVIKWMLHKLLLA